MLNALIGIVVIIVIIYISIVTYQKHLLKLAKKMETETKHFESLKLEDEFNQLKQIGLIGDSLDKINAAETKFNKIIKEELPQLNSILMSVENSSNSFNILKTRDSSDEAQNLLEKIATELDDVEETLNKTFKLAKEHRAAVSDLENRYKSLRKILLTKNGDFGPALDALEERLSSIEETFDDFSNLTKQGDHANAEKILVDLNHATVNLEDMVKTIAVL